MSKANTLIQDFCGRDSRLFYADLATPLLDADGAPRSELFLSDQLHLNPQGYVVWTKALAPILSKVLASRP
jgi:lysophospholipase L1-like esterase